MAEYNPFTDIYAGAGSPTSISLGTGLFQQPQTTEDYFKQFHPSVEEGFIPSSSGVIGRPQAENTAQYSDRASKQMVKDQESLGDDNYFGKAMEAITSLNKRFGVDASGGIPVPGEKNIRQRTSVYGTPYYTVKTSPTEYNTIEGQTFKGSQIPKETLSFGISPEMKASQAYRTPLNLPY